MDRRLILRRLALVAPAGLLGWTGLDAVEGRDRAAAATALPERVATPVAATATAAAKAERKRKRKRGKRCQGNRVSIDGRCAPPDNAACEVSPICRPVNVVDDQGDDAAVCLHTVVNLCDAAYACRTNTDCAADELCSRVDCPDGFFRCQRLCLDPSVVAAAS
jgi:hypothetical protein